MCDGTLEFQKKDSAMKTLRNKKKQAALTTKWLLQNYSACSDVCLPREVVYEHYIDFCRKEKVRPACKATFGKLIRNTFPNVTSKRLGARGHSKYHYNGIGIKQNPDVLISASEDKITRFSLNDFNSKAEAEIPKKYLLSSKVGTLLPKFPEASDLILPDHVDEEKVKVFLMMYRTHCQCITDIAISGNFEEIRSFLLHFWQGFPDHLMPLLTKSSILDVIAACDSVLYRTLLDILIPTTIAEVPERLLHGIHNTSTHWDKWIETSLENLPMNLRVMKKAQAKSFAQSLRRYAAFLHLAQITRHVFNNNSLLELYTELQDLLEDVAVVEWTLQSEEELEIFSKTSSSNYQTFKNILQILLQTTSINNLTTCLDKFIKDIIQDDSLGEILSKGRFFILRWIYTLGKMSYYLSENCSNNFTTFHLLSSFIQEYILLAMESQIRMEEERSVNSKLKTMQKNSGQQNFDWYKEPSSCFLVTAKRRKDEEMMSRRKVNLNQSMMNEESFEFDNFTNVQMRANSTSNSTPVNMRNQTLNLPSCKYVKAPYIIDYVCQPLNYNTSYEVHSTNSNEFTQEYLHMSHHQKAEIVRVPPIVHNNFNDTSPINQISNHRLRDHFHHDSSINTRNYQNQNLVAVNNGSQPFLKESAIRTMNFCNLQNNNDALFSQSESCNNYNMEYE